ncbi:MAG: hypothetical protein JWN04_1187 [Myxococcaceae bacterium]|nr:hypothetical protein [Myxococcaceae bacterium]
MRSFDFLCGLTILVASVACSDGQASPGRVEGEAGTSSSAVSDAAAGNLSSPSLALQDAALGSSIGPASGVANGTNLDAGPVSFTEFDAGVALGSVPGVGDSAVAGGSRCDASTLWEPNDSAPFACLIRANEQLETQIPSGDAADFFLLPMRKGSVYTLEITNLEGCALRYEAGLGADGKRGSLLSTTTTDNGASHNFLGVVREFSSNEDGVALLSFATYAGTCPRYGFVVQTSTDDGLAHDGLTFEPNNSASTAAVMTVSKRIVDQALVPPLDQTDYYRFDVKMGVTYTLQLENLQGCSLRYSIGLGTDGQRASLLAPTNTDNGASHNYLSPVREFTSTEDGTALLMLGLYGTDACPSYGFSVLLSTDAGLVHDSLTGEPNETPSTALVIAAETTVQGSLATPLDDNDYFRVPVTPGSFSLEVANPQGCNLRYEVGLGDDGRRSALVAASTTDNGASHNYLNVSRPFVVPESGNALVHISGYGPPGDCPSYSFTVKRVP